MEAIDWMRNKSNQPSQSTILFWIGWLIGLLGIVLAWIVPGALLVLFLLAIVGFALAGRQKIEGDREQRLQIEQERKVRDDADQRVFSETQTGRTFNALSQPRTIMRIDNQGHQS